LFPEFAVLPLNLVPCCPRCNERKKSKYATDPANPLFVHAYCTRWADEVRFLFADIVVEAETVAVTFEVAPPAEMEAATASGIVNHFHELDLQSYYTNEAMIELGERMAVLKGMRDDAMTPLQIKRALRRDADGVASMWTRNYWLYALLDAMADSEDICSCGWLVAR